MSKRKNDYCVYRYTLAETGEVIYIGKTDASLKARIDAHERELKFRPYRGLWRIDFIWLANRVETDIVEKYLINLLKPVLNDKDCEAGLTNMDISLPEWIPYESYVESKKSSNAFLSRALEKAYKDSEFFDAILDAAAGNGMLVTSFLHPSGILPVPTENATELHKKFVTKKQVEAISGGRYIQELHSEYKGVILMYPRRIEAEIWCPVAELWNFTEAEQVTFYRLETAKKFAKILSDFKENGFYEDDLSEHCMMIVKDYGVVAPYYQELFLSVLERTDGSAVVEVDSDGFEKIPAILEEIASKECVLFRAAGMMEEPHRLSYRYSQREEFYK